MTDRARVNKVARKCSRMIREQEAHKGERPKAIRVRLKDYLTLTEAGYTHVQGVKVFPS